MTSVEFLGIYRKGINVIDLGLIVSFFSLFFFFSDVKLGKKLGI